MAKFDVTIGTHEKPAEPAPAVAPAEPRRPRPRSSFDAAKTTPENRRHWANADSLSAKAAYNVGTRQSLRNRMQYEFDNNGYAQGLGITLANDIIGTGPKFKAKSGNANNDRAVEDAWGEWEEATEFSPNLYTAAISRSVRGEALALLTNGDNGPGLPQLDVYWFESDLCTTPGNAMPMNLKRWTDGIELDARNRPLFYHILRQHPGDEFGPLLAEYDRIPASQILHWFRRTRLGQVRGLPDGTPSLPLYAQMRRWTLSTLLATELASDIAVVLTNAGVVGEANVPWESWDIERGTYMSLPPGADAKAFKSEHPNQLYSPFKQELIKETARPHNAPYNVASGDSSQYNYSSARLDHLLYRVAVRVFREWTRRAILERVFKAWYTEARMIRGYLPSGLPDRFPHCWYWDGFGTIDPLKEATADTECLANGTTTLQELLAESGQDWEEFLEQRAAEIKKYESLGIPLPEWAGASAKPAAKPAASEEKDESEDKDESDADDYQVPESRRKPVNRLARYTKVNGNGHGGHK